MDVFLKISHSYNFTTLKATMQHIRIVFITNLQLPEQSNEKRPDRPISKRTPIFNVYSNHQTSVPKPTWDENQGKSVSFRGVANVLKFNIPAVRFTRGRNGVTRPLRVATVTCHRFSNCGPHQPYNVPQLCTCQIDDIWRRNLGEARVLFARVSTPPSRTS